VLTAELPLAEPTGAPIDDDDPPDAAPARHANGSFDQHDVAPASAADPPDERIDYETDLESSRLAFSPGRARLLTIAGVFVALVGELFLQLMDPSNRGKALGLGLLVTGAGLFGLGAVQTFLRPVRRWSHADRFPPLAVFPPGPSALAAGTGTIVFATLLGRLWSGSTAATDLILWAIALLSFTMGMLSSVPRWQPSRRQLLEAASVAALVVVFIALNAHDLNDWYYSAIGDEYAFLAAASGVLADGIRKPFSQDGVYGAHPMLGTLFQAAVMRVFGNNHFGWIFSSVLSAALAIPAVYLIGRVLGGWAVGLIAAALFGFNHYLFAFAHRATTT
jgi:hypothetical protein